MPTVGGTQSMSWNVRISVGGSQSMSWNVAAPTPPGCPDTGYCNPIELVRTDFLVQQGARVAWTMRPSFIAPKPWSFQLQVGHTANPLADDWQNVGAPVENSFLAVDPSQRAFGKQLTTHYRVQLTDAASNTYLSAPATVLGLLDTRRWLWARDLMRQERLRFSALFPVDGWILKRRREGQRCRLCTDKNTGDVTNSRCDVCLGTGFVHGYYAAMPCQYGDLSPYKAAEIRDPAGPKQLNLDLVQQGRFLGTPWLSTNDVWVARGSGLRYWMETVEVEAHVLNVPIVLNVTLYQYPFNDPVYKIPMGGT